MAGWVMNKELQRIWKEAMLLSRCFRWTDWEGPGKTSVTIVGVPTKIRIEHDSKPKSKMLPLHQLKLINYYLISYLNSDEAD
jgi:hypothetical protein